MTPRRALTYAATAATSLVILALGRATAAVILRAAERAGELGDGITLYEGEPDE